MLQARVYGMIDPVTRDTRMNDDDDLKKILPGQDRTWICVVAREHLTNYSTEANDTNTARRETYAA